MTSRSQPRKIIVLPAASRVDEKFGRDFVMRVNDGLQEDPRFRPDDPHIPSYLLEVYYQSLKLDEEMAFRIGRVAAYHLQNIRVPLTDRRPAEIVRWDAIGSVARSVARVINARRAAAREASVEPDTSEG